MNGSRIRAGTPTRYGRTNFKSRLEARWAAFFDLIGWRWVYEPLALNGYSVDFLIEGPNPLFVEVGPVITWPDYVAKAAKADRAAAGLAYDVLIVGPSAVVAHDDSWYPCAGWLGEFYGDRNDGEFSWAPAVWAYCESHRQYAIFHSALSFDHRPCGGPDREHAIDSAGDLAGLWAEAGNDTQWRPA